MDQIEIQSDAISAGSETTQPIDGDLAGQEATDVVHAQHDAPGPRPQGLPDKFWDDDKGAVRTDALASSYLQLEQKLGAMADNHVPADPSGYEIQIGEGGPGVDEAVNERLHQAGFSQQQAQLVYDLAGDYLTPMVSEMAAEFAAQGEQEKLSQHFGGDDRWRELSSQIREWGKANLADDVYGAMASSVDGIKAMHRMMNADEPTMMRDGHAAAAPDSEDALRALMRDPKYWRDHDPVIVDRVRQGFERLYPDQV